MYKRGAFSDEQIEELMNSGHIIDANIKHVNPASLDICAGVERYRINSVFMPKLGETVRSFLPVLDARIHSVDDVLEKDVVYLFRIKEQMNLPDEIFAACNPKSSTGRHDLHVRIIADETGRYDTIPKGYKGELWAMIISRSYPIVMPLDYPITQVKFNAELGYLNVDELKDEWSRTNLLYHLDQRPYDYESFRMRDSDGGVILTVDLSTDIVGYQSSGNNKILNLGTENGSLSSEEYYYPIHKNGNSILLKKDNFYILSIKQAAKVPPHLTSEMVDVDSRIGEFRSHYAGFFDPGWGYGVSGEGVGRPYTLEVRPYEDITVNDGQTIGKIKFEYMSSTPKRHYDERNSNYLKQSGPKLAKQFR